MPEQINVDEILPPALPRAGIKPPGDSEQDRHASARIIARWLDELIHIPGTSIKIGLDPLLAFVPGIGDFLSSSVSAVVMIESVRKGVAASVIARMGLNVLVNALFDAIPAAGPFFSMMFKSNSRNLALLHRWEQGEQKAVKKGSRLLLTGVVLLFFLCIAGVMVLWGLYLWGLMKLLHL